jgi:hypothetical protein
MAAQPVRPALRLLLGPAASMAANWCICTARGIVLPHASVVVLAPWARTVCHGPRTSRSQKEVVRGGDLSGIPLMGNWSEMLPTGRRPDVLPVWVLTGVLSPPRLESWP